MDFSVTFRKIGATDSLKDYAHNKMSRLQKYFTDPLSVHVTMSTERHNHRVDVKCRLNNGMTMAGHESTENMYSSIDLVIAKLERQVRRYKTKLRKKERPSLPALSWVHTVVVDESPSELAHSDEDLRQTEPQTEVIKNKEPKPVIVRSEALDADSMLLSEAIMQMNLNHQQFLVFRNQETGSISVIYRKEANTYGLIQEGHKP